MAKFISQVFADIRGQVAGLVYSRNTYANYTRANVSPVNPNTIEQQLVRARFGASSQDWSGLTDAIRQSWVDGAAAWTRQNVFGLPQVLTGFNLKVGLDRNRQEINETLLTGFVIPASVTAITSLSFIADTGGGTLITSFAPAIPGTQKVVVTATPPQSVGKKFVKSEFRKIAVLDVTDLTGTDLAAFYIATFGTLPVVGSRIFIEFKPVVVANGQPGVPLKASDIAI